MAAASREERDQWRYRVRTLFIIAVALALPVSGVGGLVPAGTEIVPPLLAGATAGIVVGATMVIPDVVCGPCITVGSLLSWTMGMTALAAGVTVAGRAPRRETIR